MEEKDRQIAINARDRFNEKVSPELRGKYPNIKKGQDKMNYYFNLEIYPQYVWVNICQEIRKVANPYCPSVESERFIKGEEPTEICTFHKRPGPEICKVPNDMTVPAMVKRFGYPIMIAPIMVPSDGIEINVDEDHYIARGLNRIVKKTCGNAERFFGFGGWELPTLKRVNRPYLKNAGKFKLDEFNPDWIDTLDRRIGQRAERQLTSIITLIDNCSTHTGRPGFWNAHPWNGNNNINGTSTWKPSIYHFYEAQHQDVPGIKETAKYIEAYVRFLVRRLDKKYWPFIHWEITNEGQAGHDYNKLIRGWLREEGVKENWRVQTSLDVHFKDSYKKQMSTFLNYSIHGINTWEKYKEAKKLVQSGVRFLPSEDGEKPRTPVDPHYKDLVYKTLKDGALGYEGNERPWWHENVFNPDLFNWHFIKMVGDGFKQWLEENG